MAGPYIKVAQGLTVLREATYLTDAGIGATNGLEFTEARLTIADAYDGSREDVMHGAGGALPPTRSAGRTVGVRIVSEMKGRGSAYTDPLTQLPIYHVMLGCALSGTVAGGAVTMSPVRPDRSGSFGLGFYTNDTYFLVAGVRGSLRARANHAKRGFWEFTGNGILVANYPVSQTLPAITYTNQAKLPPVWVGDSPALGSWTPVVGSYDVNLANTISARGDGGQTDGHAGYLITQRAVTWAFPGEAVDMSTYAPFSTSYSGTTAALSIVHGKGVVGHSFAFSAPYASVRPPELADDTGRLLWNLNGTCAVSAGNDELTITIS